MKRKDIMNDMYDSREYVIPGSKIHIESGYILLTFELRVKRLRRFDLPPADLDHAMIYGQIIS